MSFFRLARLLRAFRMVNHFHHLRLLFSRIYNSTRGFNSVLLACLFVTLILRLFRPKVSSG